jgi:magnesium transporter
MKKTKHNGATWLQLLCPKSDDLDLLKKTHGFHSITLQELRKPSLRAKVERYKDYLYMVLHFPIYNEKERTVEPGEVDFLITKNTLTLATVRYNKMPAVKEFEAKVKEDKKLQEKYFKDPVRLLYYILSANFEFSMRQLDHVRENIDKAEKAIYGGQEKKMLEEIAFLMRDVNNFNRIIKFHHDVLESLKKEITKLFGTKYKPYFANLEGQAEQVKHVLDSHTETVKILHDTNETLLSAKTNEAIKLLSVIAVFTFPLALLAAVLGLDTQVKFIIGTQNDLWIIVTAFIAIALIMYAIFKRKDWV